jgi:hypothetical protein
MTYLTPQQLADRWGLRPATLADWRVKGQGPRFVKPGRTLKARVRYSLDEIEAWERANQHDHTADLTN